jgi:hypothetical protein
MIKKENRVTMGMAVRSSEQGYDNLKQNDVVKTNLKYSFKRADSEQLLPQSYRRNVTILQLRHRKETWEIRLRWG